VRRAPAALAVGVVLAGALVERLPARAETRRYVMIVAHNRSLDPGVAPLRYADDDGARYFELFKLITDRVALFSVLDDDTAALFPAAARATRPPEADAIYGTLRSWNEEMAADARAGRSTELIFIYAGHGDVDASGEGYVNLLRSKLRRRDLYQKILAPSKASYVHLIIDACKSYFLVKRRGPWKDDRASESHDDEVRAFLSREDLSTYPRVGVILATSGDQATHEWSRFRGGILSYELRSALVGPADINGDGRIEYSELHAFIAAANSRLRHAEARLNIFVRPPQSNRHQPLVDLRTVHGSRARLLRFDARLSGHYYLEDDRGVRYLDLHKAPGVRFDLAVERDRTYYVHTTRSGEAQEARLSPGGQRVAVAALSFSRRALAARGSIEQSFRRDLYQLAYSRGFYDGFCARTGIAPVEGGPEEFIVGDGDPEPAPRAERRHQLLVGYMVTSALLDLSGGNHGLHLRYDFGVHRYFTVGAAAEYGRTGVGQVQLHRFAALVGAAARVRVVPRLSLRAGLLLGYQGYFGSGPMQLAGHMVEGSDALGFRLEVGAGVQLDLTSRLYAELHGGVGVDVVTIEPQRRVNTAPYGAIGLGVRF
jgi:hypothetical protein